VAGKTGSYVLLSGISEISRGFGYDRLRPQAMPAVPPEEDTTLTPSAFQTARTP